MNQATVCYVPKKSDRVEKVLMDFDSVMGEHQIQITLIVIPASVMW